MNSLGNKLQKCENSKQLIRNLNRKQKTTKDNKIGPQKSGII